MIFRWLGLKLLGVARGWWLLLALALIAFAIVRMATGALDETATRAEQAGRTAAEARGMQTTIDQIGAAHDAAEKIRLDVGHLRFCQCLHDAAPPFTVNCFRYLANKPLPVDAEAAAASCAGG